MKKSYEKRFRKATTLVSIALVLRVLAGFGAHIVPVLLYDATYALWLVACLCRDNRKIFTILTILGSFARILCMAAIMFINEIFSVLCWLDIIVSAMLILCTLNVLKDTSAANGFIITRIVLSVLFAYIAGGYYLSSELDQTGAVEALFVGPVLAVAILFVSTSALIPEVMLSLSGISFVKAKKQKKQWEEMRREAEEKLISVKQRYEAEEISEEEYDYWRIELLKDL